MTCDRSCVNCYHYIQTFIDIDCCDNKCARLQNRVCDPIYGIMHYHSYRKLLNCESEREESKDISEWIFGERKDKCGKEGKYWKAK